MRQKLMYNKKGFTLLELAIGLIVLSIILITSNTLMNNLINAQKYEETINEVTKIGRAISGDPDIMRMCVSGPLMDVVWK